jgi:hypothetical protein
MNWPELAKLLAGRARIERQTREVWSAIERRSR